MIIITDIKLMISNGNRTEWNAIQGAIGPVDRNSSYNSKDEYNVASDKQEIN